MRQLCLISLVAVASWLCTTTGIVEHAQGGRNHDVALLQHSAETLEARPVVHLVQSDQFQTQWRTARG